MFTDLVGIGLSPRELYGTSLFIQHELLSGSKKKMENKAKYHFLITDFLLDSMYLHTDFIFSQIVNIEWVKTSFELSVFDLDSSVIVFDSYKQSEKPLCV